MTSRARAFYGSWQAHRPISSARLHLVQFCGWQDWDYWHRTAVLKFSALCKAGNCAGLNEAAKHYPRKRVMQFNRGTIEQLITYCESPRGDLFAMRDRAFVLTLADTGLRVSEACSLEGSDIDCQACRAIIIG